MAGEPNGRKGTQDPHTDVTGALHDVSNALTVILGWVSEARLGAAADEVMLRALGVIEQQARIARDLARRAIGAETQAIDRDDSVDAVLDQALSALEVEAQRSGVALERTGESGVARVVAAGDLLQVVTNLLLNALAYAPRGSRIVLEVGGTARAAIIDVQDEGRGVPPERRPTLFDGHESTRPGGAGLGLAHSRALALAAMGDLALLDSPKGARFRVTWSYVGSAYPPPPSMPSPPLLSGTRVLVVEDDEHVTLLLQTALEARGAHVTVARTAEELAVAVAKDTHDAALIDLSPIAADVEGAIASLRKHSPTVALVFISGSAVGLPEALQGKDVRWVRKPFEVGELVSALVAARTRS